MTATDSTIVKTLGKIAITRRGIADERVRRRVKWE
jgi:hypothetical protein